MTPETVLQAVEAVAGTLGRANLRGAALADAVAALSARYTRLDADLAGARARDALCARLRFFLPRDLPKIEGPLAELLRAGALHRGETFRILDVGSGLGATGLGAARYLLRAGIAARVEVLAQDVDADALRLGARLAAELAEREGLALQWQSEQVTLGQPRGRARGRHGSTGEDAPHLVLLGFVLNEICEGQSEVDALATQEALVREQLARLAPDGALIVLEPALRTHSRALAQLRQRLIDGAQDGQARIEVFAPCLHRGACPLLERERDWCHESLPLSLPEATAAIARDAGLRVAHLTYSYLVLTAQARSLASLAADGTLLRVVSGPLASKGKLELMVCDDGPLRRLRRLDRNRHERNLALERLARGSIVRMPGASAKGERLEVLADTSVEVLHDVLGTDGAIPVP